MNRTTKEVCPRCHQKVAIWILKPQDRFHYHLKRFWRLYALCRWTRQLAWCKGSFEPVEELANAKCSTDESQNRMLDLPVLAATDTIAVLDIAQAMKVGGTTRGFCPTCGKPIAVLGIAQTMEVGGTAWGFCPTCGKPKE